MTCLLLFTLALTLGLACSDDSYNHYRLPTALRPQKYDLTILTHLENPEESRFIGTVKILIEALQNTRNITLHSKDLTIKESQITLSQVSGTENQDNCVTSTAVNPSHGYYILNTCQELLAGNVYELQLSFSADLKKELQGYYRSSYVDPDTHETRWIALTQFEPAAARSAFSCFDEPNYKARFIITLGYPTNYMGLSNMPAKETKPHESLPDYVWTEFQESVPMSTYLVAWSVNDFDYTPSTLPNGVLFRTWARPNAIDQCDYASWFGPKVLQYYEELFGIKFPLPKIDQIAVPDFFAGAMENWGLVTYREMALLYSTAHSSLVDKQRVASVVAHELAHQWFGNLVTMKWWTDLWLNEGFATYVASLGVAYIYPEWRSKDLESLTNLLTIFRKDALESSHPISRPIKMVSKIQESLDEISYQKGSSVIRMMHLFLGEEAFRSGLKSYLEMYAYSNADQDNLWKSLTQAAHKNGALPGNYAVKAIMDSWTLQTGYPLINVARDYAAGSAVLTQERYLLNTEVSRSHHGGCWWVPLSYTTQVELDFNNTSPKDWLQCSKEGQSLPKAIQDLPGADQWVIFNTQLSAPYKVNYDAQNWKLLIRTLNSKHFERIHVVNRAQLIDDVLYFAWTGEQDYETALEVIDYLHRERELLPWRAALDNLKLLNRIVRQTTNFGSFKSYIRKLIAPIYGHLNGINNTFSSIQQQDQILLKALVGTWACDYEVSDCVPRSLDYFRDWQSEANPDQNNPVPLELHGTVYCTAIRLGSEEDWQFLWTRYLNANVAADKAVILGALACSRQTWILQRLLETIFHQKSDIRSQDAASVFRELASNKVGYPLAKQYLMNHIRQIHKFYYPLTQEISLLLPPLAEQVICRRDYDEFRQFVIDSAEPLKNIGESVAQTLEIMATNVQWMKRNYIPFFNAIQQQL